MALSARLSSNQGKALHGFGYSANREEVRHDARIIRSKLFYAHAGGLEGGVPRAGRERAEDACQVDLLEVGRGFARQHETPAPSERCLDGELIGVRGCARFPWRS